MKFSKLPTLSYVLVIPISVYLFKSASVLFLVIKEWGENNGVQIFKNIEFISAYAEVNNQFLSNFISAFGILYSVLLSLLLVRGLEGYDNSAQEFETEAGTIRILYKDFLMIPKSNKKIKKQLIASLFAYAKHVSFNYQYEVDNSRNAKINGDELIGNIRDQLAQLVNNTKPHKAISEAVFSELIQKINDLEDIRIRRIEYAKKRLSGAGFQIMAVFSASLFLIPFYFTGFSPSSTLLENILVFLLTGFVITLNIILGDFNEPFNGIWKIKNESWKQILENIKNEKIYE